MASKKRPQFVELFRGSSLNSDLVAKKRTELDDDGVRHYYIIDRYDVEHEVNRTHYNEIVATLGI